MTLCSSALPHCKAVSCYKRGQGFARAQGGPRPSCIAAPPLPTGAGDGLGEQQTWHGMLESKDLSSGRYNWFYNKKIIPLTAEEATDLANPLPQYSPRQFQEWDMTLEGRQAYDSVSWEEGIPHSWMNTDPRRETAAPWPKRKGNAWIKRALSSPPRSLSSKVEFMKKAPRTGKASEKKEADLSTAVQAHILARI